MSNRLQSPFHPQGCQSRLSEIVLTCPRIDLRQLALTISRAAKENEISAAGTARGKVRPVLGPVLQRPRPTRSVSIWERWSPATFSEPERSAVALRGERRARAVLYFADSDALVGTRPRTDPCQDSLSHDKEAAVSTMSRHDSPSRVSCS